MHEITAKKDRHGERGSARIKFFLVLLIIVVVGNALINYIPVAYQGESFKQEMQTIVVQGTALPTNGANPVEVMKSKLNQAAKTYELPPAQIHVKNVNNVMQAHVSYSKDVGIIPFGIYTYHYQFSHTATPTGFLMKN